LFPQNTTDGKLLFENGIAGDNQPLSWGQQSNLFGKPECKGETSAENEEKATCEMCDCEFELNPEIPTGGME